MTESASRSRLIQSGEHMPSKNERVELEMKIIKYRQLARASVSDPETEKRISGLIAELEQKRREIDE